MTTAFLLILVGVLTRFMPHLPNAVPLGAITLYAGARLPRWVAVLVPLAILAIFDLIFKLTTSFPFFPSQLVSYAIFAALAVVGGYVRKDAGPFTRVGMSVFASTVFFLVSNFAVWAEGSGYGFSRDLAGLLATYSVGLLFYGYQLLTDLIGTTVLFGAEGLLGRASAPAKVAAVETEIA